MRPSSNICGPRTTNRLEYLYRTYIEPIQLRFLPVFDRLREQRRIKEISPEVFYFLLTSGGSAPYGQAGIVSLMNPAMSPMAANSARMYAESVAEVLINGIALPN